MNKRVYSLAALALMVLAVANGVKGFHFFVTGDGSPVFSFVMAAVCAFSALPCIAQANREKR